MRQVARPVPDARLGEGLRHPFAAIAVADDLAAPVGSRQLGKILGHDLRVVRRCNAAQHVNDDDAVLVLVRDGDASRVVPSTDGSTKRDTGCLERVPIQAGGS